MFFSKSSILYKKRHKDQQTAYKLTTVCLLEVCLLEIIIFLYFVFLLLDRFIIYTLVDIDVGIYFVVCCLMELLLV